MVPRRERKTSQAEFMQLLRENFNAISPDTRAVIQDLSLSGFSAQRGFPVEFSVRGRDWEELTGLYDKIVAAMRENPHFSDVDSDFKSGMTEIQVIPNRMAAEARAVSVDDIATTINILVGGIRD